MGFIFENLEVYQKAVDFAHRISSLTEKVPRGNYYLTDQLNRASVSISANIAEGNGRFHKADRRNFFYISRGSMHECVPLIELAKRKSLIDEVTCNSLRLEVEVLAKMISGLINGIKL
jgi:four helix bundle protein